MRNNILVNNGTFYYSTLNEKGDIKVVNNFVQPVHEQIMTYGSSCDMLVLNKNTGEVITKPSSVLVYNLSQNDEYFDKNTISSYCIQGNNGDIIEYITPQTVCLNIKDARHFYTLVVEPEEKEYNVPSSTFYTYDKNLIIESDYESICQIEFNIIQDNSICINNAPYISHGAAVNNANSAIIGEDSPNINLEGAVVLQKAMTEVLINDQISLSVKHVSKEDGYDSMPVIGLNVVNVSNTVDADINGTGGDLKSLIFTIQQMSFFEFKLKFKENKVREVFNLPTGLFFDREQQRIVGTPIQSGRYSISVIFEDNSTMDGIINVPKINREL